VPELGPTLAQLVDLGMDLLDRGHTDCNDLGRLDIP
jgi:hypothetical protein